MGSREEGEGREGRKKDKRRAKWGGGSKEEGWVGGEEKEDQSERSRYGRTEAMDQEEESEGREGGGQCREDVGNKGAGRMVERMRGTGRGERAGSSRGWAARY